MKPQSTRSALGRLDRIEGSRQAGDALASFQIGMITGTIPPLPEGCRYSDWQWTVLTAFPRKMDVDSWEALAVPAQQLLMDTVRHE